MKVNRKETKIGNDFSSIYLINSRTNRKEIDNTDKTIR